VTGIGHEGRAFRRVLVHKRIHAVLLVKRVRAQLALFGFPGREVPEWALELKCLEDSVGRPGSRGKWLNPTRYPALGDRDLAFVDMILRGVYVAVGN
jgi:hypothetical protein